MSERALSVLKEKFGAAVLATHSEFGDDTALVEASSWKAVCAFLRNDAQVPKASTHFGSAICS